MFLDVETTGHLIKNRYLDDSDQPHIIQVAYIRTEDDGTEIDRSSSVIRPKDWGVPKKAVDRHGITHERAQRIGIPVDGAIMQMLLTSLTVSRIVAHGAESVRDHVTSVLIRRGKKTKAWQRSNLEWICTMERSTELCAIDRDGQNKWPSLEEAAEIVCDRKRALMPDGKHNAMEDAEMVRDLYFKLVSLDLIKR